MAGVWGRCRRLCEKWGDRFLGVGVIDLSRSSTWTQKVENSSRTLISAELFSFSAHILESRRSWQSQNIDSAASLNLKVWKSNKCIRYALSIELQSHNDTFAVWIVRLSFSTSMQPASALLSLATRTIKSCRSHTWRTCGHVSGIQTWCTMVAHSAYQLLFDEFLITKKSLYIVRHFLGETKTFYSRFLLQTLNMYCYYCCFIG